MTLPTLTYTGVFRSATCNLTDPATNERLAGCGKNGSLESFLVGEQRVYLCPHCAGKFMVYSRRRTRSNWVFCVGEWDYAVARRDRGGWLASVSINGQKTELWEKTLVELEVQALAWYRYFTKRMT